MCQTLFLTMATDSNATTPMLDVVACAPMSPEAVLTKLRLLFQQVVQQLTASQLNNSNEATGFKFGELIDTWLAKNKHIDLKRLQHSVAVVYTQHVGYSGHAISPRRYNNGQRARMRRQVYEEEEEEEDDFEPYERRRQAPVLEPPRSKAIQEAVDRMVAEKMVNLETRLRREFASRPRDTQDKEPSET
jgi:hypothetical protein